MAVGNPTLQVALPCRDRNPRGTHPRQGAGRQTGAYGSGRGNDQRSTGKPGQNLSRHRLARIPRRGSAGSGICRGPDSSRGVRPRSRRSPAEGVDSAGRHGPSHQARSPSDGILLAISQPGIGPAIGPEISRNPESAIRSPDRRAARKHRDAEPTEPPTPELPLRGRGSRRWEARAAVWKDPWNKPTRAAHRVGQTSAARPRSPDPDR